MKKQIPKESPFEIHGHEFQNLSELMDAVEVEVEFIDGLGDCFCPKPDRKSPKIVIQGLHILMFRKNSILTQKYITDYEYSPDPIPMFEEDSLGQYYSYTFFFSTEPFTDLMIGSIWGWLTNSEKNLPLCVYPFVEYCSLDNYLTIKDGMFDESERADLFESIDILAEESTSMDTYSIMDNDVILISEVDENIEVEICCDAMSEKEKTTGMKNNSPKENFLSETREEEPSHENFKVKFEEISKDKPFEVMGHVFQNLDDLLDSVDVRKGSRLTGILNRIEPKKPVPGLHILEIYELYPCFDSYDYANEDRFYCNYFFSSEPFSDEEVETLRNIKQSGGVCLVNENTPKRALPALYYKGEGYTMLLATLIES